MKKTEEKTKELSGLICVIKDGDDTYEIQASTYQFTLTLNNCQENKSYHVDIYSILEDILHRHEKKLMIADNRNNLIAVKEAIIEAQKWMEKIVRPVLESKNIRPLEK